MVANSGGKKPPMPCRPLFGEHHVVVRGAPKRVRVGLVGAGVPKLKETNRHVATQIIHVARGDGRFMRGMDETAFASLGIAGKPHAQCVETLSSYDVDAVHSIQARAVEVRVIEENAPEIVGKHDVGVDVKPPPCVLAAGEARVQRRAFIKAPTVLVKEVGLDADRAMLASHSVGRSVVVRSDHDERIYMRVVGAQRAIKEVINANACGDGLNTQ